VRRNNQRFASWLFWDFCTILSYFSVSMDVLQHWMWIVSLVFLRPNFFGENNIVLMRSGNLTTSLQIGQQGDKYEQQATRPIGAPYLEKKSKQ